MRKYWAVVCMLFVFSLGLSLCNREFELPKLYEQASPSVVWIGAEDEWTGEVKRQGTGFFVTPNLIATAGHVIENTKSFEIMFSDGTKAKADFVHMESSNRCDVGFIKIRPLYRNVIVGQWHFGWCQIKKEEIKYPYLNLDVKVKTGENIFILGYPWGLNNGVTLTQGIVSLPRRKEPFFGTKLVMQVDSAAWPGNSGSPVIDMDGECVGILIGRVTRVDNFSIVIPAKLVKFAMQKALAEIGLREAK